MCHFSDSEPAVLADADSNLVDFAALVYKAMRAGPNTGEMDSLRAGFASIARSYAGWRFRICSQLRYGSDSKA